MQKIFKQISVLMIVVSVFNLDARSVADKDRSSTLGSLNYDSKKAKVKKKQ